LTFAFSPFLASECRRDKRTRVVPSLKRHRRAFCRAPELYGADRGFFSEQNVAACVQGAVKTVCIPQRGGSKTPQRQAYERSAAFKQGQRFRAGMMTDPFCTPSSSI
jgi:hypothetical protein